MAALRKNCHLPETPDTHPSKKPWCIHHSTGVQEVSAYTKSLSFAKRVIVSEAPSAWVLRGTKLGIFYSIIHWCFQGQNEKRAPLSCTLKVESCESVSQTDCRRSEYQTGQGLVSMKEFSAANGHHSGYSTKIRTHEEKVVVMLQNTVTMQKSVHKQYRIINEVAFIWH